MGNEERINQVIPIARTIMTKQNTKMPQIEKLLLNSMDIQDSQIEKLKELFPEVFTEGNKIDWDKLKLTLGENVDAGKERFGMNWPGKADCFKTIQQPSIATLVPNREESVDFDNTQNLFIEGDNLEVLKLLQKSYLGKIKMIYIDPPYNTGNDFIYPDNYTENLATYLEYTGQVDSQGKKFSTNTETDGRFHSKWMNMMYPRLFLAKNLLSEDGLIFISIDDKEVHNLRNICNEIFGEENFIDPIIWKKRYGGGAKEKFLVALHEYILVYAKNKIQLDNFFIPLEEESIKRYYTNKDEKFKTRGGYRTHPLEGMKSFDARENLVFPITTPDGTEVWPKRQWRWGRERVEEALKNNEIEFTKTKNGEWVLSSKQYLYDENGEVRETKPFSIIDDIFTQHGTNEIVDIFGNAKIFDYPKPSELIIKLIQIGFGSCEDGTLLDFFSGSSASAHALLESNKLIKGNRKFICVQLPEPIDKGSDAEKAGFKNIADIGKERIRRVIEGIKANQKAKNNQPDSLFPEEDSKMINDLGFRVFKLQKSNFRIWDANILKETSVIQKELDLHTDHISADAKEEAIFYEILIKSGFEPTIPVERIDIGGKQVFSVASGELLICLEKELTLEIIKAIAERKPTRVICLDEGFQNNDQLKTNAVQIMKSKNVVSFRTV